MINKNENIKSTNGIATNIIKYNSLYGINYKEICELFKLKDSDLDYILSKYKLSKSNNEGLLIQIESIIDSKNEEVNAERLYNARIKYCIEMKRFLYIKELKKRQMAQDYKFTREDLRNIVIYRVDNNLSRNQVLGLFPNLSEKILRAYEDHLTEGTLKDEVNAINEQRSYKTR